MKSIRYMPSLDITRLFFDKPGFSARWRSDVQIALTRFELRRDFLHGVGFPNSLELKRHVPMVKTMSNVLGQNLLRTLQVDTRWC